MSLTSTPHPRSQHPPHITVVVPAYNEAAAIASTLHRIAEQLDQISAHWDIVVIDDGSRDLTAQIVVDMRSVYRLKLIRFSRNFGKEYAITAGLEHAAGDIVICMDADGQHAASLMLQMLDGKVARGLRHGLCRKR